MSKTLIIIDMQNDFINGSLANSDAQTIVKPICDLIKDRNVDNIILTRDTHQTNYLKTPEGKALPVEHCIEGTPGWCVANDIQEALRTVIGIGDKIIDPAPYVYLDKRTFGYLYWKDFEKYIGDEITIVGTCTDICVISNALILKTTFPNKEIIVLKDLCAGLTKEKHEAALEVMRSCQIKVR